MYLFPVAMVDIDCVSKCVYVLICMFDMSDLDVNDTFPLANLYCW